MFAQLKSALSVIGCFAFFACTVPYLLGQTSISLPSPALKSTVSIEEALHNRRASRLYSKTPIPLAKLSQLLWAGQGITKSGEHRTAPSAGATYPVTLYLLTFNTDGINSGIFEYLPLSHQLSPLKYGDFRKSIFDASLKQESINEASAAIVICADTAKMSAKFGNDRGFRYANLEVGCVAQNIFLQCIPLGLATVSVGHFDDNLIRELIGASPNSLPLFIMPVGTKDE